MKLYQTIDGTLIGFYQERGGAVQAVLYRDVYETELVTKTREVEVIVPGYYEEFDIITPGYWKEEEVWSSGYYRRQMIWKPEYSVTRYREVPGHYEIRNVWVPEYTVTRYREVEGHYEIQPFWFEEHTITKYYWREPHPARGLPGAWIPYEEVVPAGYSDTRVWVDTYTEEYEEVIPAGYKDQRVWVDTYTEEYQEIIPAGESMGRVWVEGKYIIEDVWVEETTRTERVWVPATVTHETVEYQEFEEVWAGREPVYEYVDPAQVRLFEALELIEAPAGQIKVEDAIVIRNTLTGEELTTTARYLGLATKIDENEYVVT